ncbi:hypothetical protein Nans01_25540 [Nocardiopsis ansamitocini]|uniref:Uncharacterized protein n=1 Tax=Nocardiopsis ansamitocini TaxID=1670832 RepID=A0A9W6P728_9ACTN|nr:hypothetical protein Nans01_25540 [Nocardiopsis ansamitocini]
MVLPIEPRVRGAGPPDVQNGRFCRSWWASGVLGVESAGGRGDVIQWLHGGDVPEKHGGYNESLGVVIDAADQARLVGGA